MAVPPKLRDTARLSPLTRPLPRVTVKVLLLPSVTSPAAPASVTAVASSSVTVTVTLPASAIT